MEYIIIIIIIVLIIGFVEGIDYKRKRNRIKINRINRKEE
jgi:hypothetical protein